MIRLAGLYRCSSLVRYFSDIEKAIEHTVPTVVIPTESILATRPAKGLLWGDGEVYVKYQKVKFKNGKVPSLKRIKKFLEHEQGKDITTLDVRLYSKNTIFNILMVCTGVTPRHISRMAYSLLKELKAAEVPESEMFKVIGTRDSGWMILIMKDVYINFLTEEMRPEIDLENHWKTPLSESDINEFRLDEFEMYNRFKKKR